MHIEFTENISAQKWKKIVDRSEQSYFYHTPMWADILERTYGYETATHLYEIEGVEILVPLMKLKWNLFYKYESIPMGYGGFFSESELSINRFEHILSHLKNNLGLSTLMCTFFFPPFFEGILPNNSYFISAENDINYTHILPLAEGKESLWDNRFSKKNRNMIRNAEKKGVEIFKTNKISDFESYYRIYLDSVKRWGTKNIHPFKLYEEIQKYKENITLWLASVEGEIIGGIITMEYGRNIISFGGASLSNFWRYSPNNLLYKDAIEYSCEKGFKYFDFGQSRELLGVRKFKESFGAERINLRKYVILSQLGRIGNMILKKY